MLATHASAAFFVIMTLTTMDGTVIIIIVVVLAASACMSIGAALLFGLSSLGSPDSPTQAPGSEQQAPGSQQQAPGSQQQQQQQQWSGSKQQQQQPQQQQQGTVRVFADPDGKGDYQDFGLGNHDLADSVWNNRISSVLVPEGLELKVYEGDEQSKSGRFLKTESGKVENLGGRQRGAQHLEGEKDAGGCSLDKRLTCWNDIPSFLTVSQN